MDENRQRSFTIPLVELVLVVGIFAVLSVILMKMYLSADTLRDKAVTVSEQTILAENDIEILKGKIDDTSFEEAVLSMGYASCDGAYTKEVKGSEAEQKGMYVLTISDAPENAEKGVLHNVTVQVVYGEEEYSLSTAMYVRGK